VTTNVPLYTVGITPDTTIVCPTLNGAVVCAGKVRVAVAPFALTPEVTHTITIIASSVMGVLENKVSGRRTNRQDYQIVYAELNNSATDPSMDRVDALFNQSFDFGKPYVGKAASSVDGPGAGGDSGGDSGSAGDSGGDG